MHESRFKFSRSSLRRLKGYHDASKRHIAPVHPVLADIAHTALRRSTLDFGIASSTVRTKAEQKRFLDTGKSATMDSKHLPQRDGFIHAIDVAGYDSGGRYLRNFEEYYPIAEAFQQACFEHGVGLRWGGAWMSLLDTATPEEMAEQYIARVEREFNLGRRRRNRPLLDGVHFELPSEYR